MFLSNEETNQFFQFLSESNLSQYILLVAQAIITLDSCRNYLNNQQEFPVKQLSPLLSVVCLLCFFLLNVISLTAKIIEQENGYYDSSFNGWPDGHCGICRIHTHQEMLTLAFIYNGLRQLPLIIFVLKTFRVCICYNFKGTQPLPKWIVYIFGCEKRLLGLCVSITVVILVSGLLVFGDGTPYNGKLIFEFFCPKQSSILDWIINSYRFLSMVTVYLLSLKTYAQLDFKRFLVFIFILTNTEVLLRIFLVQFDITKTTYHQFYYHSMGLNLFGSLILQYYSFVDQEETRNPPLGEAVLDNFNIFLQTSLGYSILYMYARHKDIEEKRENKQIYTQTFEAYWRLDEINKMSIDDEQVFKIEDHTQQIIWILENIEVLQQIANRKQLIQKCEKNTISLWQLKEAEAKLNEFCVDEIFFEWRNTESSKCLEKEFKRNTVINLRMSSLGIEL